MAVGELLYFWYIHSVGESVHLRCTYFYFLLSLYLMISLYGKSSMDIRSELLDAMGTDGFVCLHIWMNDYYLPLIERPILGAPLMPRITLRSHDVGSSDCGGVFSFECMCV